MKRTSNKGLYLVLISVHGLIRGRNLELGRDADTGGQTLYVVELARALAAHPDVERVDLLTRRVVDPKVDKDYAEPEEVLAPGAHLIRLDCGPRRYLRKEVLWPHLEEFVDKALQHVRSVGRVPDFVHSHYADAGLVGARLANLLGVPLVHTGHSLGRDKYKQLLKKGQKPEAIESNYNISQRIEAEEFALDTAALVIASTRQEVDQQYSQYDNYQPRRMVVIPPGVDLSRFHPPRAYEPAPHIAAEINRFLARPRKPMILALSRADERKNIGTLVRAYGESQELQRLANLVIIAGNRDDIEALERGPREIYTQLLLLIDRHDLYGKVAYPKHHESGDVPDLYRMAARSRGLFVNPALTEPFGLTLIEAAASGLPIVATEDGGPRDIVKFCKNGWLIDPHDADALAAKLVAALSDKKRWRRWADNGVRGAHQHFSWPGHADTYVRAVRKLFKKSRRARLSAPGKTRLPMVDRIGIASIDNTLIGDPDGLKQLLAGIRKFGKRMGFGVATGRRLESAIRLLKSHDIPIPDVMITSLGSEIYYCHNGARFVEDIVWKRHIDYRWDPDGLRKAMDQLRGVKLQARGEQRPFKLSYYVDPETMPTPTEIKRHLRRLDLHANVIYSRQSYLDLVPIRASKGQAIRYLAMKWGIPLDRFFVAGDSGNDAEMLQGDTLAVVVGNYSPELKRLKGKPRIYFAKAPYAAGVLEGIEHYQFAARVPVVDEGQGTTLRDAG